MSSKPVYITSSTIRCPTCAKAMLLKNWKSHCRQMHTMSETAIDAQYIELKKNVEQSKTTVFDASHLVEKPTPLTTNTLFSMKKFALSKPTHLNVQVVDVTSQINQPQMMELDSQVTSPNSVTHAIEPASLPSNVDIDIHENSMLSYFFKIQ
jgi:hypothetical protein